MSRSLVALDVPEKTKTYVRTVLNPVLEKVVIHVIRDQPDNPEKYMYEYFQKSVGQFDELNLEIERLKTALEEALRLPLKVADEAGEPDDELENDDDEFEEMASNFTPGKGGRSAVSAEAYGEWNKKLDFVPPVFPKSDEQKSRLVELFSRSFLFASLEEADKAIVVDAIEEVQVPAATAVITQGDIGDFLFVIESGTLNCLKQVGDEPQKLVKVCEPGDVFGELSLLYNAPRAATVVAVTDCVLWKLDRSTFTQIVREGASKKRDKYESFLRSVPLLAQMGLYELGQMADALSAHTYGPSETIVEEGTPGNTFFILEEGSADAFKSGFHTLHYERPGEYFGELALIKQEPRAATVKAGENGCKVLALERRVFNRLLGDMEELVKRVYE